MLRLILIISWYAFSQSGSHYHKLNGSFVCVWVRVAEYLDVDEKSYDYNDIPPVLMTRDVLAKFRTMEAESQQQVPLQQRHVCALLHAFVIFGVRHT